MTLEQLRNDLGSVINQTDSSGDFTSTIITSTEADRWLNQAFEEVYMRYAMANRVKFQRESYADTVADQDTYTFGGDATDLLGILWLGVKYASTDDDYTRARPMSYPDVMLTGSEERTQTSPVYFRTSEVVSGATVDGIKFAEGSVPDAAVTDGLKLLYIERPATLSDDADEPDKIPPELDKYIVYGAAEKCFLKMEQDSRASEFEQRFSAGIRSFVTEDQASRSDGSFRIRSPRWDAQEFCQRKSYSSINSKR